MNLETKPQPGKKDSKKTSLNINVFKTGSTKSLICFLINVTKIIKRYILKTSPGMYDMTKKALQRSYLHLKIVIPRGWK